MENNVKKKKRQKIKWYWKLSAPPDWQPASSWTMVSWKKSLHKVLIAKWSVTWCGISFLSARTSCPGCVPTQPPAQRTCCGGEWEAEKPLTLCKHCSAIARAFLCYQHCFDHRSITQLKLEEINSIPARPSTLCLKVPNIKHDKHIWSHNKDSEHLVSA